MDESDARGHLLLWLCEEAGVRPEVVAGLEEKLAEQQVFEVRDLVLLREGGLLETVFDKFVTRRKVEIALDRHAQEQSPQQPPAQLPAPAQPPLQPLHEQVGAVKGLHRRRHVPWNGTSGLRVRRRRRVGTRRYSEHAITF